MLIKNMFVCLYLSFLIFFCPSLSLIVYVWEGVGKEIRNLLSFHGLMLFFIMYMLFSFLATPLSVGMSG